MLITRICDYCLEAYSAQRARFPGYCCTKCRVAAHRRKKESPRFYEEKAHYVYGIQSGDPRVHYIYGIQCGDAIKVGMARDFKRRLSHMRGNCPYELKLVYLEKHPDKHTAFAREFYLHGMLADYRIRYEWFYISLSLLERIALKCQGIPGAKSILDKEANDVES